MSHPDSTSLGAHPDEAALNDIADDRLAAAERAVVEAHLNDCAACRAALDSVRQVIALGRTDEARAAAPSLTVAPPPELWTVVAATTVHERLVRRHVLRSMRGGLALAALVLVAASSAATIGVMRLAQRGAALRESGPPTLPSLPPPIGARRGSVEADLRRATERQLVAHANAEAATLRRLETADRRVRAEVDRRLAELDSVLDVARAAALAAPGDDERLRVVEDVYRRRQDAIRRALEPR